MLGGTLARLLCRACGRGSGLVFGCALLGARLRVRNLLLLLAEESAVDILELSSMLEGG